MKLLLGPIVLAGAALAAAPSNSSAQGVTRMPVVGQPCAACHLPNGAGVPGAFPPLRSNFQALAGTAEGRRYIVLAVTQGLTGPLTVEGKRYSGIMPAQALKDDDIARILNGIAAGGTRPFTGREVAGLRSPGVRPADVAKRRPAAAGR